MGYIYILKYFLLTETHFISPTPYPLLGLRKYFLPFYFKNSVLIYNFSSYYSAASLLTRIAKTTLYI